MRPKYSTVIALFCAVVYLLAVGVAANRIISGMNDRRLAAEREFKDLVERASAAAVLGFMEQPFLEALRDGLKEARTLRAVIVSGPYGSEYAVERSPGYLAWTEDNPRFVERFGVTAEPYVAPLRIEGVRNATLRGVAEYMDRETIGGILTYALIAVAAALGIALLTLILEGSKKRGAPPQERPAAGFRPPMPADDGDEPFEIPSLDPEISGSLAAGDGQAADLASGTSDFSAARGEDPCDDGIAAGSARVPKGLYSPRSNISWESYTRDRLSSELHRSASFEQDLVYIVMELPPEEGAAAAYAEFAAAAAAFFTFRDLIFERGDHGISVILPNVDLDHGFRMAEEFRNKLLKRPLTPGELDLRIGLSSRSGRLVDADRVMVEAERALAKASEDEGAAIVAFKSDPERYRAFIAGR